MDHGTMEKAKSGLKEYVFEKTGKRFKSITDEITNRIDYEISIIEEKQLENIFIMYSKIIEKCNERGILHGPEEVLQLDPLWLMSLELQKSIH